MCPKLTSPTGATVKVPAGRVPVLQKQGYKLQDQKQPDDPDVGTTSDDEVTDDFWQKSAEAPEKGQSEQESKQQDESADAQSEAPEKAQSEAESPEKEESAEVEKPAKPAPKSQGRGSRSAKSS